MLLKSMGVSVKSCFSSARYHNDCRKETSEVNESIMDPSWQRVEFAGIPFYLNH